MPDPRPRLPRRAALALLLAGLSWPALTATPALAGQPAVTPTPTPDASAAAAAAAGQKTCAAVRGNGAQVFVHFASLARFHELVGPLWGISGGSSGSVVSLIVDSIYRNPFLQRCGQERCSARESAARAALLLKTFPVHLEALASEPDAGQFFLPAALGHRLEALRIPQRLRARPAEGLQAFRALLQTDPFRGRVNPEILSALAQSPQPAALALDISRGILGAREFALESNQVFLRPGASSFRLFADHFGRLASFYAGEGGFLDGAGMQTLMRSCATPGRGLEWSEVARLRAGQTSCGALFTNLLQAYVRQSRAAQAPTRAEQPIGSEGGLHVLVSVTQMGGGSAARWQQARQAWLTGRPIDWTADFQDWSVAYMGREADLDRLSRNPGRFTDLKTQRTTVLRGMRWRDILERSPAEPGISRALELPDGAISTGGWGDGQPVQALRNIGCERVVLFDKTPEERWRRQVAGLLGATPTQLEQLFAVKDPGSSLARAFADADLVWCSNWDRLRSMDLRGMSAAGWNATLEVRARDLLPAPGSGLRATSRSNSTACTAPFAGGSPGLPAAALRD